MWAALFWSGAFKPSPNPMGFLVAGSGVGVSVGSLVGVCVGAVGVTTAAWLIVSGPLLGVGAGAVVVATAADLFAAPDVSGWVIVCSTSTFARIELCAN